MKRRGVLPAVVVGLSLVLGIAFFLGPKASDRPDGLARVARDQGLDDVEKEHPLADGPLADYAVKGVEDPDLGRGLAGVVGALAAFGAVTGLLWFVRRSGGREGAR